MLFYQSEEGNEVRAVASVLFCTATLCWLNHTFVSPIGSRVTESACSTQGREAYLEKRPPDFSKFRRLP